MATADRKGEYLCRLEIAAGHRKFGLLSPRKEPKEDDEGGDGSGGSGLYPPEFIKPHPLLADAAQFSGDYQFENPVAADNYDGKKELQHRYEKQLDKRLQQEKHINLTPHPL